MTSKQTRPNPSGRSTRRATGMRLGNPVAAVVLATAVTTTATPPPANALTPAARAGKPAAEKEVTYRGYRFTVPGSWRVVDLARHPTACVRFDRHALYLGTPGTDQRCPGHAVGHTEAILAQPPTHPATAREATDDPETGQVNATTPRVDITATYRDHRSLIRRILADAGLPPTTRALPLRPPISHTHAPLEAVPELAAATQDNGNGFDTCAAPSTRTMTAWRNSSPYRAVGIYIGGSEQGCNQPNLTTRWVQTQYTAGWRFEPLYVGEQADRIRSATREGTAAADDAAARAATLGFGPGSTLYYDMEAYRPVHSAKVLAFEAAWTGELHALGYHSGFYSSSSSGIADLVHHDRDTTCTMPDVIFDALWNHTPDTNDPAIPTSDWNHHQRIHQYATTQQTWGGITQSIDQDYLDVHTPASPLPGTTPTHPRSAQPQPPSGPPRKPHHH